MAKFTLPLSKKLRRNYRISYLHNPKHFYLNSIQIEDLPNGDKLITATPRLSRNNRKNFHRLALLKRKKTLEEFVIENTVKSTKVFNGIFQD